MQMHKSYFYPSDSLNHGVLQQSTDTGCCYYSRVPPKPLAHITHGYMAYGDKRLVWWSHGWMSTISLLLLILAQVIKLCSYRGISLIITLLRNQGKSKKTDIKHAQVNNTSWCSIVFFLHPSVAPPTDLAMSRFTTFACLLLSSTISIARRIRTSRRPTRVSQQNNISRLYHITCPAKQS